MFGSWFGFTAYIWLLHHVRPALAGSYAYVNPAIAVALGAWLAHERFGAHELVAMGVIPPPYAPYAPYARTAPRAFPQGFVADPPRW